MAATRRILVLKASGLGDLMVTLPAIESLKAAHAESDITLVVRSPHGQLGPCLPYVDRVVELPNYPGVSGDAGSAKTSEAEQLVEELRGQHFDLAVQMHGGGRYSNELINRLEAKLTLGLKTPDAASLDIAMPYVFYQPEVARYLELISLIDVPPCTSTPHLTAPRTESPLVQEILCNAGEPVVLIHPGNGSAQRRWPAERFAAVGNYLASRGIQPIVIGAPHEQELVSRVLTSMDSPAQSAVEKLDLATLVELYHHADLLVASAGGALMVGVASQVPTVGIYTGPVFSCFAPSGRRNHRAQVAWRDSCPICHKHPRKAEHYWNGATDGCDHKVSWVTEVSVDEVTDAISDLLEYGGKFNDGR